MEFISAERLIFFSDAVAAIAMTLLAFTLKVPASLSCKLIAGSACNHAILNGLWNDRLSYLEFLISFVVIGGHWRSHHRLFRYVNRLDSRIITLNMVWLLMIVIIPFATELLSGRGGFGVRFSLYAIIQVLTLLTFLLMSRHLRGSKLLRPGAPQPSPRDDDASLLAIAAMFAISIPVAFVTQWAFVFWVASSPAARAVRRYRVPATRLLTELWGPAAENSTTATRIAIRPASGKSRSGVRATRESGSTGRTGDRLDPAALATGQGLAELQAESHRAGWLRPVPCRGRRRRGLGAFVWARPDRASSAGGSRRRARSRATRGQS